MKTTMPNIFSFSDYREFLREIYVHENRPRFTIAKFSKFLGFRSPNYAGLVLSGKRNLTITNVIVAAKALKLTFEETQYLEALVQLNQAASVEERKYFGKRLRSLKGSQPRSSIRHSGTEIFSDWYFPAVVALVDRTRLADALEKIVSHIPISTERAADALKFLMTVGLIRKDGDCYALSSSHQIFFDEKSQHIRQKKYLLSQIDLSKRVFQRGYDAGGKFYSQTFSVEKSDLSFYQERIRSLLAEVSARSDETIPEGAAQLNIQLFPIELSLRSLPKI